MKNPVVYWRLAQLGNENAYDSTDNGHTGRNHSTLNYQHKGAIIGDSDTAMSFDGK
jgi:hypothetical protein